MGLVTESVLNADACQLQPTYPDGATYVDGLSAMSEKNVLMNGKGAPSGKWSDTFDERYVLLTFERIAFPPHVK